MVTKQERGLSYKRLLPDDFINLAPAIRVLVKSYIEKAGDKYTVDQIMDFMHVAIGEKTFLLFFVEYNDEPVGMLTAHAVFYNDKTLNGMVHIGYIEPHVPRILSTKIVKAAMDALDEWAIENKMPTILLQTERQDGAFMKLMGKHGWKKITTVYSKEVTNYGRRKESGSTTDDSVESSNSAADVGGLFSSNGREPVSV